MKVPPSVLCRLCGTKCVKQRIFFIYFRSTFVHQDALFAPRCVFTRDIPQQYYGRATPSECESDVFSLYAQMGFRTQLKNDIT